MTITVSSKGQVTLPAAARKRLGLRAGRASRSSSRETTGWK